MTKNLKKHTFKNIPNPFNLNTLDGLNGFMIPGEEKNALLGWSIKVGGDVNGDGLADMAIGAIGAGQSGEAYVIFGSEVKFQTPFNLTNLDGTNGFKIPGRSAGDNLGQSVALDGDVNQDGLSDIIIGAYTRTDEVVKGGEVYVIFGQSSFADTKGIFDLQTLTGKIGCIIPGVQTGSGLGWAVSSGGDINGDEIDDFVLGANGAEAECTNCTGKAYVIFGAKSFPLPFNLTTLNGLNGFSVSGLSVGDMLGSSVAVGGDINNDGKADFIIGAIRKNSDKSGEAYVIFGQSSFADTKGIFDLQTLTGKNGFTIPGLVKGDCLGGSVAMGGDVNGNGFDDLVLGAPYASPKGEQDAGEAYIILGNKNFNSTFNLNELRSYNGFRVPGVTKGDNLGWSVSIGGGMNSNDKADIVLGAYSANLSTGEAYVIYGTSKDFPTTFNLTTLDGTKGFKIPGSIQGGNLGMVSIHGDVNGDGRADLIFGAGYADFGDKRQAGEVYAVFSDPNEKNYGMLSSVDRFYSMNSTYKTGAGALYIGNTGQWCNAKSLYVGDFNGDKKSDLLCNMREGENYIMLAYQDASFDVGFKSINNSDPNGRIKIGKNDKWCDRSYQKLLTGDFNGDNKTDLFCRTIPIGVNYVMLSNGTGFNPMSNSTDGEVKVGPGQFCFVERLVIGDFDGNGADDLFCNDSQGNMIMVPNGTNFISHSSDSEIGEVGFSSDDPNDPCPPRWCSYNGAVLEVGDFDGDGKDDLICNYNGPLNNNIENNMIMLSTYPKSSECDFKPIMNKNTATKGGCLPIGNNTVWCDTSRSKLIVEDVDGKGKADLICNTQGTNEIMLCEEQTSPNGVFKSINSSNTDGQIGMGADKHYFEEWCLSQNLFGGDFNADGLGDLLCSQGGQVYGT